MTQAEHTRLGECRYVYIEGGKPYSFHFVFKGVELEFAQIASGDSDEEQKQINEMVDRVMLCVNALRGLNPEAVAALIKRCEDAEGDLTRRECIDALDGILAALAAVKVTPKGVG